LTATARPRRAPSRRTRRTACVVYAVLLSVGTHWPGLAIDAEAARPDLVVHMLAFGALTSLLVWSGWFGAVHSRRNAAGAILVATLYAIVDEASQAVPALRRHASWDDLAANALGVAAAGAVALALSRPRACGAPVEPRTPHPSPGESP